MLPSMSGKSSVSKLSHARGSLRITLFCPICHSKEQMSLPPQGKESETLRDTAMPRIKVKEVKTGARGRKKMHPKKFGV